MASACRKVRRRPISPDGAKADEIAVAGSLDCTAQVAHGCDAPRDGRDPEAARSGRAGHRALHCTDLARRSPRPTS